MKLHQRFVKRFKDACVTNEPQFTTCLMLMAVNTIVLCSTLGDPKGKAPLPWPFWVGLILFWPAFAFVGNLVNPIPRRNG